MADHSSILACKIQQTEERGRIQSMVLQRVEYDLLTKQQHNSNFNKLKNLLLSLKGQLLIIG